jgi:flagellar biosynthetic protein FlhB
MAEQEQNRSEKATPFKLREAKKRGQVSKSIELNAVLGLTAFVVLWLMLSGWLFSGMVDVVRKLFSVAGNVRVADINTIPWIGETAMDVLILLAPLMGGLMLFALISSVMQTGFVWSGFPLKPDFTRLNPAQGFKKLFSLKMLFELAKSLLKIGAFVAVGFALLGHLQRRLIEIANVPSQHFVEHLMSLLVMLAFILLAVMAFFALLDLLFSRWQFAKQMMMSRREVKDEVKKREGDPDVRSKRKKIQAELIKKAKGLNQVKDADVVITNPTHFAVALKYDYESMIAPQILALGTDSVAKKIKMLARKHRVPIIENRKLARSLYKHGVLGAYITEAHYQDVAKLFRWLFDKQSRSVPEQVTR